MRWRLLKIRINRTVAASIALAGIAMLASCSAKPPPALPPPNKEVVWMQPANPPPPDEWNLFPDPTTGEVDVYHRGDFVGAVTGNEPADQDPPLPHPVASSPQ